MRGDGAHHQPPGTWSDDGALILCTVESLLNAEFDTADMGRRFVCWRRQGLWTATGTVFDVGNATATALRRIEHGIEAERAGGPGVHDNGNGSLMRIAPVALRFASASTDDLLDKVQRASSITHAHDRSTMACSFFALTMRELLRGHPPSEAFDQSRDRFRDRYQASEELGRFGALLGTDVSTMPEHQISTTGYVVDTLVASVWCLLTTKSYRDCVLRAVNLGGDTDTTGCVAGALAGCAYGLQSVPLEWRATLPRGTELETLLNEFADLIC
jgi:ADP-ribosylglycohydrolase